MKPQIRHRIIILSLLLLSFGATVFLFLVNFRDNVVFFFTPTEFLAKPQKSNKTVRLGGKVKEGSIHILSPQEYLVAFRIADLHHDILVHYQGFLPALFREGQYVVVEGIFDPPQKVFKARRVLAKHDETYRPNPAGDVQECPQVNSPEERKEGS